MSSEPAVSDTAFAVPVQRPPCRRLPVWLLTGACVLLLSGCMLGTVLPAAGWIVGASALLLGLAACVGGGGGGSKNAPVIELEDLAAANGWIIRGEAALAEAGYAVSTAGDMTGDGDGVVIGSPGYDNEAGKAYIIFGDGNFSSPVDLSTVGGQVDGFTVGEDYAGARLGTSVGLIGDIDSDGNSDVIVSSSGGSQSIRCCGPEGQGFVIYGDPGLDGASLDPNGVQILGEDEGFIVCDDSYSGYVGTVVGTAGDVNNDDRSDILLGDNRVMSSGVTLGNGFVLTGGPSYETGYSYTDLQDIGGTGFGFRIQGNYADEPGIGRSGAGLGKFDGDNFDDVAFGAPIADYAATNAGRIYVWFGAASFTTFNSTTDVDGNNGVAIDGESAGDQVGFSVGAAGDVNDDGFDDLIVGAPYAQNERGRVYVVFGSNNPDHPLDLGDLDGSNGFRITGESAGDRLGWSVNSAGDVDGDGVHDLLIGAPAANNDRGRVYVLFGGSGIGDGGSLDLDGLKAKEGAILVGAAVDDLAGWSVAKAGDVDGDGVDDVIVGAPGESTAAENAGSAYVIFGVHIAD